jgi:hypothetical protein
MNRKITGAALSLTAFATLTIAATAIGGPARADDSTPPPKGDGCPAGYQLLSIAELEAISGGHYVLAAHVDSTGNNNGYVCGNDMPPGWQQAHCQVEGPGSPVCELMALGLPSYGFLDDVVPGRF